MRSCFKIKGIDRIIDANSNRLKEGLRVCEEIARFILNSRKLTEELKKIRHGVGALTKELTSSCNPSAERDSLKDVGRTIYINELKRRGYQDIAFANIQRVKESIRVLEEFSKLKNIGTAVKLKKTRYKIYQIEKDLLKRIPSCL